MNCSRAMVFLLLGFFSFLSSPAYTQINLKTGYNFSLVSYPGLDRLISAFNASQPYSSPFHDLRWLQGFEAGVRLKKDIHALEVTYQGASRTMKASGINSGTSETYTDHLVYSIHSGAIGYQLGSGSFGFGTDLQYQLYKIKYKAGLTKDVFKTTQHRMAFKIYAMFTFSGSESTDFVIQPYVVLPMKEYDLFPLSAILNTELNSKQEKWIRYGVTLLFYNGRK